MKKSKIEFDLVWKAVRFLTRKLDEFRGVNMDFTELTDRVACLEDEVMELVKADSVYTSMNDRIEDLERMIKAVDDRRIEAVMRADKQDEVMRADKQDEIIGSLSTGMGNLATVHRDLSIKLGDMAKTVDSLEADSEALMSDSAYLYRREKELQAQVDELQTKVNDQAEALEYLSTGMENVAKALTNLDGWMTNVEVILSAFRKST